jgi:3-hydroxybutyryl-CoA dehydratase
MNGSGVRYDDARIGTTFSSTLTVTETHLVLGAGLIGDFNPHHVDDSYAKRSRYGGRILHGMLTGAIMGAPLGMYFHGTAIENAGRQSARAAGLVPVGLVPETNRPVRLWH